MKMEFNDRIWEKLFPFMFPESGFIKAREEVIAISETRTEQGIWRATFSAVLPNRTLVRPVFPSDPMMTRFRFLLGATFRKNG